MGQKHRLRADHSTSPQLPVRPLSRWLGTEANATTTHPSVVQPPHPTDGLRKGESGGIKLALPVGKTLGGTSDKA